MYYSKTVNHKVQTDEEAVKQEYDKYIVETAMPKPRDDSDMARKINENNVKIYQENKVASVRTPRLLSIQSYQDLFNIAIERCKLRHR